MSEVVRQQISGELLSHPDGKPLGDLLEMRRYAPGDPLKLVLWKLYARSGQLLVRTPERAISTDCKTVHYLVAAEGDEPAAGICRAALLNHQATGVLFGTDGDEPPTSDTEDAVAQLARSSAARREGGTGLTRALAAGAKQNGRACVLYVPPRPGAWLERVSDALAMFSGKRTAVIGIDGPPAATSCKPSWIDWLVDSGGKGQLRDGDVQEICRLLGAAALRSGSSTAQRGAAIRRRRWFNAQPSGLFSSCMELVDRGRRPADPLISGTQLVFKKKWNDAMLPRLPERNEPLHLLALHGLAYLAIVLLVINWLAPPVAVVAAALAVMGGSLLESRLSTLRVRWHVVLVSGLLTAFAGFHLAAATVHFPAISRTLGLTSTINLSFATVFGLVTFGGIVALRPWYAAGRPRQLLRQPC